MTAPGRTLCTCGDIIDGEPAGLDERGFPLCWRCAMQREMETAHDWPPGPGSAAKGCLLGMLLSCAFWGGVALLCALLVRG